MTAGELARLDRVLALLPAVEATWVRSLIEAAAPRQCRIRKRDAAICEALAKYFPGKPTPAAKALRGALNGYATTSWQRERDLAVSPSNDLRQAAMHEILRLSGGRVLCWKQLKNIAAQGNFMD
jgi:hypothetical protein